jgi:cyclic pyranopterin phosphate synthase
MSNLLDDKRVENSLIDNFGRAHSYLRISVTDRCNLRCVYCMPHEGLAWQENSALLSDDEIVKLAKLFVSLGVTKIRLTGGEPMVRANLSELIARLGALPSLKVLAMTTNGTLLEPELPSLKASNLKALNISLDTLRRDRFLKVTRRDQFDTVFSAVQSAIRLKFELLKLNVVVMGGFNDDEIMDFADFAFEHAINVRFIEFMPFKDNSWDAQRVVTYQEMRQTIEDKYELVPLGSEPSAVGKDFQIKNGKGQISFVSSMSDSFCSTCNRLRLTADGQVKACLFHPAEVNLRDALRLNAGDEQLKQLIFQALKEKPEAHLPAEQIAKDQNRAMIEIGG